MESTLAQIPYNHEIKLSFSNELSDEALLDFARVYGRLIASIEIYDKYFSYKETFPETLDHSVNLKHIMIGGVINRNYSGPYF